MQPATLPLEVTAEELEALLESVREGLGEAGYQKLKAAIRTLGYLTELLRERKITLEGLRELLLSGTEASTEKTRHVLKQAGIETQKKNQEKQNSQANGNPARPGHGRHGVDAYGGAKKVQVPHPSLHSGDRCPGCGQGKVYVLATPGVLVRMVGQAPITGTVYELEKLRCNLCLEVFTAEAPAGVGEEKYDATSASMMALLKYGSGMPFYRLEGLQEKLEIPLPASTQWGIVKETAEQLEPALEELIRQAAQGEVVYNDDTGMKVLALPAPDRPALGDRMIAFGIGAVALPAGIMFGRILDVIFGVAKPLSGSMTAVAALLALVALVAVDGLVNLFGTGVMDKRSSRIRGVVGVAAVVAAVFWPGRTVYVAVELIGLWAILIGVLELIFARYSGDDAKDRALLIIAAIASIVIGVGVMKWAFAGAVVVSAFVGTAAAARGVSLIMSGISERSHQFDGKETGNRLMRGEYSHGFEIGPSNRRGERGWILDSEVPWKESCSCRLPAVRVEVLHALETDAKQVRGRRVPLEEVQRTLVSSRSRT